MSPRKRIRPADGMRAGLPPLLRHLSSELGPGVDPVVRSHLQSSLAEAVTARTLEPVEQLPAGEKRALLGALDRTLGHRSGRPDPRAVVELTGRLLPALPGEHERTAASPAPAR